MKRLVMFLCAVLLAACASMPDPRAQIALAQSTVDSYVTFVAGRKARGLVGQAEANAAADRAERAMAGIAEVRKALALCAPAAPTCQPFTLSMQTLQPTLLELERELRAKEGAKP